MRNNSTIFKNPQDEHLFDLSLLGTVIYANKLIEINQQEHYFQVADVLYYDIKEKKFAKAYAINNIQSEVCGVVSEVIDNNTFRIVAEGFVQTDKYDFDIDTPLYLSEAYPGKLMSIPSSNIIKQIATQTANGIMVDIQRGYYHGELEPSGELESYTQEELDEIIKNIW